MKRTAFSMKTGRRLTAKVLNSLELEGVGTYTDKQGNYALRYEIGQYLQESRGVACTPEQIILCCGTQYALDILCRLFAHAKNGERAYGQPLNASGETKPQSLSGQQSKQADGHVLYTGTFSKTLAPGLRLSYLVLPEQLLSLYHKIFTQYHSTSVMDSSTVSPLYSSG